MSRGWEAVSRIGEGLLARGERKRQLDEERKYLAEQSAIEAERTIEKAKVLQQLKDDNKAAADAAKAAREQVLNLGDGQVGIYSNDPDGKIRFRTEGERKPNLKYLSTDEGLLEYDPATGSRKRIAGLPTRAPAAWNDPSTIVRDLDEEWSRVRTQLDTKISDIEADLLDPRQQRNAEGLRLKLENTRKLKAEREAEIKARRDSVMGSGPATAAPKAGGGEGLFGILGNAAQTAFNYGRNEDATMRGIASGAVPMDVGASALSAQSGQPVSLSIGGSQASAAPPNNGPARTQAEKNKGVTPGSSKETAIPVSWEEVDAIPDGTWITLPNGKTGQK